MPVATTSPTWTPNPVRGRLNSAFFAVMDGYINRRLRDHKRRIFAQMDGVAVEIGAGNGPNLRYLPPGATLHAIEPNPHFHGRLLRAAAARHVNLTIHPVPGEAIDLADRSADAVLCSWVLCTVQDPARVLQEIRRVLRPGGRFMFLEHVAAPPGSVRRVQKLIRRPWRWIFEGCQTDRDTAAAIHAAGFSSVDITAFRFRSAFVPVRTQIAGIAIR